jgi:hypothetical protein
MRVRDLRGGVNVGSVFLGEVSMSEEDYRKNQIEEEEKYEARCLRCGVCCGALGDDPCANLRKAGDGKYFCAQYAHRIGPQKTVSGKSFICVPIRTLRVYHTLYPLCPYLK